MKKATLLLFVAVAFFSSCKKDQKKGPVTPQKTYKVNFNVSDFTQILKGQSTNTPQTNGLITNDAPLSSFIDVLYYYVYDTQGNIVHTLTQQSSVSNFGTITDELPPGDYTIAFAGGKTGLNLLLNYEERCCQTYDIRKDFLNGYGPAEPQLPWKDTFYKKINVTISGSDINQSVSLNRIVSQLTVNVEDAIPANAYRIAITGTAYLRYSFYKDSVAFTTVISQMPHYVNTSFVNNFIIPASAKGTTNYKVSFITLNVKAPSLVKIACYDGAGNVLAAVNVNNVVEYPNTQTILSGQLFVPGTQFNLTANAKWDPTTINIPF